MAASVAVKCPPPGTEYGLRHGRRNVRRRSPRISVMRRNAPDTLRHKLGAGGLADIAEADHANHALALVDDWEPADMQLLHVMHRLGEIVVLAAAMDA